MLDTFYAQKIIHVGFSDCFLSINKHSTQEIPIKRFQSTGRNWFVKSSMKNGKLRNFKTIKPYEPFYHSSETNP